MTGQKGGRPPKQSTTLGELIDCAEALELEPWLLELFLKCRGAVLDDGKVFEGTSIDSIRGKVIARRTAVESDPLMKDLTSGEKDDVVAKEFGIGGRTVRNYVSQRRVAMEEFEEFRQKYAVPLLEAREQYIPIIDRALDLLKPSASNDPSYLSVQKVMPHVFGAFHILGGRARSKRLLESEELLRADSVQRLAVALAQAFLIEHERRQKAEQKIEELERENGRRSLDDTDKPYSFRS